MFNRILVPTDHSQRSFNALEIACSIAKKTESEIDLVHIVQATLSVTLNSEGEYQSTGKKGQQFLQDILESNKYQMENSVSKLSHWGVKINIRIKVDGFPEKVAESIVQGEYDVIIVGTHVHHGFDEFLMANVPEKIVHLANCPVLTIKQRIENFEIKKIIVPMNFSNHWFPLVPMLKKIQTIYGCKIYFVFINSPSNFKTTYETNELIKEFEEKIQIPNSEFHVINDDSINKGILKANDHLGGDVITSMSKRKKTIVNIIKGETSEFLVNHALSPVLTLNQKNTSD